MSRPCAIPDRQSSPCSTILEASCSPPSGFSPSEYYRELPERFLSRLGPLDNRHSRDCTESQCVGHESEPTLIRNEGSINSLTAYAGQSAWGGGAKERDAEQEQRQYGYQKIELGPDQRRGERGQNKRKRECNSDDYDHPTLDSLDPGVSQSNMPGNNNSNLVLDLSALDLNSSFDIDTDLEAEERHRPRIVKRAAMPQTMAFHWDWWIARIATNTKDLELKALLARMMRWREQNDIPRVPTCRVPVPIPADDSPDETDKSEDDDDDQKSHDYDADGEEDEGEAENEEEGSDEDDEDEEENNHYMEHAPYNPHDNIFSVGPYPKQSACLEAISFATALRNPDRTYASGTGWDVLLEHVQQASKSMRHTRRWRMRGLKNAAGWCKWQRKEWIRTREAFVTDLQGDHLARTLGGDEGQLGKQNEGANGSGNGDRVRAWMQGLPYRGQEDGVDLDEMDCS